MQLNVNNEVTEKTLADLDAGEEGILLRLDLAPDVAHRLMEIGFVPGHRVGAGLCAPGGDPRVFKVDGTEVALRSETARHLYLRVGSTPA